MFEGKQEMCMEREIEREREREREYKNTAQRMKSGFFVN